MADDEVGLMLKVAGTVSGIIGTILVNNRFVLGKIETCNKEALTKASKAEQIHTQNCKEDRKEIYTLMKDAVRESEDRLKEHMSLLIKASKS